MKKKLTIQEIGERKAKEDFEFKMEIINDPIYFKLDSVYDECIIGLSTDNRVIYEYSEISYICSHNNWCKSNVSELYNDKIPEETKGVIDIINEIDEIELMGRKKPLIIYFNRHDYIRKCNI